MRPSEYLEKKRALLTIGHEYDCCCDVCMEFSNVLCDIKRLESKGYKSEQKLWNIGGEQERGGINE